MKDRLTTVLVLLFNIPMVYAQISPELQQIAGQCWFTLLDDTTAYIDRSMEEDDDPDIA